MALTSPEDLPHDWRSYPDIDLPPILDAALGVLRENGYHGTTVREVAQRAKLTMPTLYYHYGNKEGILVALLDIAMDDLLAHVEGGLSQAGDDPLARLDNVITAIAMHGLRRRSLARLHPEYRFLGADAQRGYVERRAEVGHRLVELIEEGAAREVFSVRDSHAVSRAILGMLQAITDWYSPDGPQQPEQIAEAHVDFARDLLHASRS